MNFVPRAALFFCLLPLGCGGGAGDREEGYSCDDSDQCVEGLKCIDSACAEPEEDTDVKGVRNLLGKWVVSSATRNEGDCDTVGGSYSAANTHILVTENNLDAAPYLVQLCNDSSCDSGSAVAMQVEDDALHTASVGGAYVAGECMMTSFEWDLRKGGAGIIYESRSRSGVVALDDVGCSDVNELSNLLDSPALGCDEFIRQEAEEN